ncbi:MAG: response regulator [Chitinophagales bacterium]
MKNEANSRITIMIVDDDEDDRRIFLEGIQEVDPGVQLLTAEDGITAFLKLGAKEQQLPDFIFLDLNMPKQNGHEVLAELKNDELLKNIPVIIYTTSENEHEKAESLKKGAVAWITKPESKAELKKILNEMLEAYKSI